MSSDLIPRMWGKPPAGRRGPKPALSVAQIVEAAYVIADEQGLAAVSMARVAEAAGCSPMALYRHVKNKDELLILLADRLCADLPAPSRDLGWREGLAAWMRAQVDLAVSKPWFLDLPLAATLPGPNRLAWIDLGFYYLREVALPADEKLAILGIISQYGVGEARVEVEAARLAENPYATFEQMLVTYADPERFPHLMASMDTWRPAESGEGSDSDDPSAFGQSLLMAGIAAHIERHVGRSTSK
ncbi:TetR/AcrR family transcriptional regulator [Nocardioides sp. YR527]|uniref:TetR/AcrR family transcriptional regulator n=1 Tax=Nocardioides sp. YR527 TaxID=1881028 RepID=UPI00210A6489|nr:TetR/AcrR family transcriptional regulator [Nocardioides sp. YR527]